MSKSVVVLLSTYNGAKYLEKQLDSLLDQKDVDLSISIRDDGSSDDTLRIINDYKNRYSFIRVEEGDNVGFAKSFWSLLTQSGDFDYYAFCDQDDIWNDQKLCTAIGLIEREKTDIPILYTSNVKCFNEESNTTINSPFQSGKVDKYESFIRSILPGCTFVFNKKARDMAVKYNGDMYAHDWSVYCIANCFGTILYDENSYINYRMHESNTIGAESKALKLKKKVKRFFEKKTNIRMRFAKQFYDTYQNMLDGQIKEYVYLLGHYQMGLKQKMMALTNPHVKSLVVKFYIIINRF